MTEPETGSTEGLADSEAGNYTSKIVKRPKSAFAFDAHNPRLVESATGPGLPDMEAAQRLLDDHDPISIARSMARFGFFETDPLIAREINGNLEVLEGNRRLLAVRLLTDQKFREALDADGEYAELATELGQRSITLDELPVLIVDRREDANAVIGFRHIVGIKRWPAHEKAAFVARLLEQMNTEGSQDPYRDVAVLTGEDPGDVKRYVRNYVALRQAASDGVDTSRARENFGALTYALSTRKIGNYIGLIAPSALAVGAQQAYTGPSQDFGVLLSLLFGDANTPAAVTDSRRYGDLGRVLEVAEARSRLLTTRQLDEALGLTDALQIRVLKEIRRARTSIQTTTTERENGNLTIDSTLWGELRALETELAALVASIGEPDEAAAPAGDDEGADVEGEDDREDEAGEANAYDF